MGGNKNDICGREGGHITDVWLLILNFPNYIKINSTKK